ncbi:uncharacterized protein RCH25_043470 [Pelodytes ibericus]
MMMERGHMNKGVDETVEIMESGHLKHGRVSGLWNIKAIAAFIEMEAMKILTYASSYVSANEVEVNVTSFSNPIVHFQLETNRNQRAEDQAGSLSYYIRSTEGDVYTLTFVQSNPDSLIAIQKENNTTKVAILYSRGVTLPESEVEDFKQWSECSNIGHIKTFDININYAQECHGLFEESEYLDEIEESTSWGLVAKASSVVDFHYLKRILYTGRLEISKTGEELHVQEILTAPADIRLFEHEYTKGKSDDKVKLLTFKAGKDVLLLGVKTESFKALFLASKSSKANQAVLDKFQKQAQCFETQHIYYIPGSKIQNNESEECQQFLSEMSLISVKESIGKWSLTASAYEKVDTALSDVLVSHGWMEIGVENDKPFMSYVSIYEGSLFKIETDNLDVENPDGFVTFKDRSTTIKSTMYRVSPDCIMFISHLPKNPEGMIFLFCRSALVSRADIKKFAEYATCAKCHTMVIRRQSSLECLDLPREVQEINAEKITGKWTVVAVASNLLTAKTYIVPELQIIATDKRITFIDNYWKRKEKAGTLKRKSKRKKKAGTLKRKRKRKEKAGTLKRKRKRKEKAGTLKRKSKRKEKAGTLKCKSKRKEKAGTLKRKSKRKEKAGTLKCKSKRKEKAGTLKRKRKRKEKAGTLKCKSKRKEKASTLKRKSKRKEKAGTLKRKRKRKEKAGTLKRKRKRKEKAGTLKCKSKRKEKAGTLKRKSKRKEKAGTPSLQPACAEFIRCAKNKQQRT